MSDTPKTNGNGKGRRPQLMQQADVAYWVNVPLELIEHKLGLRCEKGKVYNAILRCSNCYPHLSRFAIRPKLRRGGFAEWGDLLRKRIAKQIPILTTSYIS